MLHELLLALKGHHGGVFKHSDVGIQVVPNLPFIHASEVTSLNQLCKLGTYYRDFTEFIQHYSSGLLAGQYPDSDDLYGLYMKCLCQGLDNVLQDYRDVLLEVEQDVLKDSHLPVSFIASKLNEFQLLFPALAATIDQVVSHKAHGCYMLDILYKNSILGVPVVKAALDRILYVCHGLLFKQLSAWMLHGITSDPYNEFFIRRMDGHVRKTEEEEEEDLGILGLTGRQLQKIHLSDDGEEIPTETSQFGIAADLLPSYIQPRVANKILFVGESVQMFERDKHQMKHQHQGGTIMSTREEEFAADLLDLSRQPGFNSIGFEAVINKIRAHAAEYLWMLVVEESDLTGEIRIMKDYFLLGRGELYLAFIDQAQHLLRTPVASTTEHDVNHAFQHAARNVLIDNDALLQRFHLTVPAPAKGKKKDPNTAQSDVETGWSVLGLSYTVQWPLHIFFTPSILQKYDKIFRFLLAVRRTQLDLQHCWSLQMCNKKVFVSPAASTTWQLRTHMAFLVDNLQYYLQVDVIESQYQILMDKIDSTKDFEAAKLAHEQFLSSLLAQSFVHMRTVSSCLYEILEQCSLFCRILVSSESSGFEKDEQQIQNITSSFKRYSSLLFQMLSGVRSQSARPHLAQLLLRLDFNKFFTSMGGQLGSA
ncbi:gamma-tubulin complex component 4 [Aplysia californica]|uniref:Gamma-tubulin complex component n=1 Tax=Aplysia californica TaxID=6500 RepID=A0ABM1VNU5_APLCA|nr:gamma-tubulin complex component 4 [Aplysia californica]XP_035824086.1 gamma-tubulin complex component 4 [Aplysia californica]XP_035824087.1 gamma-tubulin complex component 4 [Aplysia californica]